MGAGQSAEAEAQKSMRLAEEYEALGRSYRDKAVRFQAGSAGEKRVGAALHAMEQLGWTVLSDRRWGRRANIDFILVGPAGVAVVDVKNWKDLAIHGDSIFRGDDCQDDEIEKLLRQCDEVAEELAELGITPSSVIPMLVFTNKSVAAEVQSVHVVGHAGLASWLVRRPRRFDEAMHGLVALQLDEAFPEHRGESAPATEPRRQRVEPRFRPPDQEAAASVAAAETTEVQLELIDVDELSEALLAQVTAEPIEEWMTFLHPGQRKLVTMRFRGASRVRGSAGTGKTVVGLHRAAHLARGGAGTIYFVTFVRTLPQVLRSLATRLAPEVVERIRFTGLHQLAKHVLDLGGRYRPVNLEKVNTAFAKAWLHQGRGTVLEELDVRPSYWQEEIDYVIKGRGLTEFGEYAELKRVGRGTRMTRSHREVMWDLYADYEGRLQRAETSDFNDMLIDAKEVLRSGAVDLSCGGVIVDEVQDLTMVGLQFLHTLAGEGTDRFMIIGDGQQSIYPGGFTLSEAGIDVRGRASVLEVNYRNTAEILIAAQRVIDGDTFDDIEGELQESDVATPARRSGDAPVLVEAASSAELLRGVVGHVGTLVGTGVRPGDIGVLLLRTRDIPVYRRRLEAAGYGTIELTTYDGITSPLVKVGTVKRAKGLEFAHVLLPGWSVDPAQWRDESDDAYAERLARHKRELYVAMTRARDGLWLGHLAE